jgi:hypothetical protein
VELGIGSTKARFFEDEDENEEEDESSDLRGSQLRFTFYVSRITYHVSIPRNLPQPSFQLLPQRLTFGIAGFTRDAERLAGDYLAAPKWQGDLEFIPAIRLDFPT